MLKTKSLLQVVTLSTALGLGILLVPHLSTQVQAQSRAVTPTPKQSPRRAVRQIGFRSPRSNGEPKQSGTTGTRGECLQNQGKLPFLTPLTPGTQQGLTPLNGKVSEYPTLTVSDRPTLFVYVPQTSAREAEFVLTDANNTREIYQATFALPATAGIVRITVPSDRPPLELGKVYKWSFAIKCNAQGGDGNPYVLGWVQRTEPNPAIVKALDKVTPLERAALYGDNGIWQDLLTTLAELRYSQPENATFKASWENLLGSESVKLSPEIAQAPLLECCTPNN